MARFKNDQKREASILGEQDDKRPGRARRWCGDCRTFLGPKHVRMRFGQVLCQSCLDIRKQRDAKRRPGALAKCIIPDKPVYVPPNRPGI
jgi:hypothetical protein